LIDIENAGPVTVLRLAHGPVNALDLELCRELATQCRTVAASSARAVVLTGAGRAFSAGVDLHRLLDGGADYVREFFPALAELFGALFAVDKPVVAAVNGHAIAGGCILAAAADVTLMAQGPGRIGVPEIKVGVPFPRIALEILRHKAGAVPARRLVLGAETHTPDAAVALGLVDEVVAAEDLPERAIAVAAALADSAPADTFAVTKAQLQRDALDRLARFDDDAAALEVWLRRVTDGWTAKYVESLRRN
jgi:enoyl-CoA hydratase